MEEMNQNLRLTYQVKAEEVAEILNKMDKLQGSNKKQKLIFAAIMAVAAVDAYYFFFVSHNAFALLLMMAFLVLAVFYRKKSDFANRRLGEAFEADPQQIVEVQDEQLQLTDRATAYADISLLCEFKKAFGMCYQGNHYFVIPKHVFENDEQLEQFRGIMQEKLQERYQDHSAKM
jgi:hypothetical protein